MNDSTANGNSNAPTPSGGEERHPPQDPPSLPDQTVISQRPVAGPEDFYHSLPFLEMARHLIGKQLDHFVLDELVGGGGMGAVFRGRDLRLDRVVAVKVIPNARRDSETQRRFRVEAQSAAKLDHPNIARVYYVGESDRGPTSSLNSSKGSIFAISLPNVVRLALMIRLLHQTNR